MRPSARTVKAIIHLAAPPAEKGERQQGLDSTLLRARPAGPSSLTLRERLVTNATPKKAKGSAHDGGGRARAPDRRGLWPDSTLDLEAKEIEYTYHGGLADMAHAARVGHGQREMDEQTAITDLAAQLRAARRREHADH
ncbi:MAG: hypothetical protein ABSF03_20560 [Streptosporangiaceae bacterium]|jgi:hypothetical protein